MVTIKDVARVSGVSYSTVSRVVNGGTGYSGVTRSRVEAAVAALGYRPNTLARDLVRQERSTIGVLVPSVSESFAGLVLDGIEDAAEAAGTLVVVGRAGGRPERVVDHLAQMRGHQVLGVLLVAIVATPAHQAALGPAGQLVSVAVDDGTGAPGLAIDGRAALADAVRHLQRRGHRRIGFLSGEADDATTTAPRLAGYREAVVAGGAAPVVAFGGWGYGAAAAGLAELLRQDPELTAVVASSDELAVGVVHALQRDGRRVPQDVSVVGFDDTPVARHSFPALTTVCQPLREMGARAAEMLLDPASAARVVVPHEVVPRESTGPAPS